jgi:hypothetical protein
VWQDRDQMLKKLGRFAPLTRSARHELEGISKHVEGLIAIDVVEPGVQLVR